MLALPLGDPRLTGTSHASASCMPTYKFDLVREPGLTRVVLVLVAFAVLGLTLAICGAR
jgi:hypothetical protein